MFPTEETHNNNQQCAQLDFEMPDLIEFKNHVCEFLNIIDVCQVFFDIELTENYINLIMTYTSLIKVCFIKQGIIL